MESLYHQTNKMILDVQNGLGRLEKATESDIHVVENEIQARIDQVVSNCERLDILVNKEPPTRRSNAKIRVDQLKYDCQHLQAAMRNLQHRRYRKEEEEREREALLTRTFTTNDQDTSIQIDASLQHNQRLYNSHQGLDNAISTGTHVLSNLREQHSTLKGAKKKILDVMNTLGLSNTVMRLIERRTYQDRYILYGGMIVTCILMIIIWRYLS
ncbi:Golgi SNAP receptor complex member 2-like [Lineus longissimus]|uniref:Golgi SNAP receptor complex member 2-like n=1 Tax=Lineus longissimus TaxID=88925 RepID=UPI002B4CB90E